MSPNAARRTPRRSSHLTLVTIDTTEPVLVDVESEPPSGKHAAPPCPLPIAGSATVRALMALGALVSALGLSMGRADAAFRSHEHQGRPVEAEADTEPDTAPHTAPATTAKVVAAPAAPIVVTAAVSRTSPGHWEPVTKTVKTHSYITTPVPGNGRHRKQSSGEHMEHTTMRAPGRHRREDTPGHMHKPKSCGNSMSMEVKPRPVGHAI
jgi:hypothetical protein